MVEIGRRADGLGLGAYWTWRVEDFPSGQTEAACWACGHKWMFVFRHYDHPEERLVNITKHARCPNCDRPGFDFPRPATDIDYKLPWKPPEK